VIERRVGERQGFGTSVNEPGEEAVPVARGGEHVGALIEPDDAAPVPRAQCGCDHAGPGRDVEDELARLRIDRGDERAAPAGILAE